MEQGKGKRKLLVADDSYVCRAVIRKTFEELFEVVEARDGEETMEILRRDPAAITILLLDIQMPRMDGNAVLRAMMETPALSAIPVIITTCEEERDREADLLAMGAKDFLLKPIEPVVARWRVKNVLERYANQRFRIVVQQSQTLVIEYDYLAGRTYVDPLINDHLPGDFSGLSPYHPDSFYHNVYYPDLPTLRAAVVKVTSPENTGAVVCDVRFFTRRKAYEWYRVNLSKTLDEAGKPRYAFITLNNINAEVVSRKELEYLAERDPMTKIPNRETFALNTRHMLDAHPDTRFIMICMDMERFHIVNQLFGTDEGDRMLKFIAVRVQEAAESQSMCTYCRVALDMFGICVPYEEEGLFALMDGIEQSLQSYPLEYELLPAFGLYIIDDPELSVDTMLNRATHAQKTVKGSFVRHHAFYDGAMKARESDEQFVVQEMVRALEEEQFQIYLQPKVHMSTGKLIGSEALIRWVHPERGVILPSLFIPTFERNGFIMQMDSYAWESACRVLRRWLDAGGEVPPISVNISRVDLYNPKLIELLTSLVDQYDIPHELLELELTESSVISDITLLTNIINQLHAHGFLIHMDDFGSGYSSLNALKDIDVDVLKLDMRFLSESVRSERGVNILRHTIAMAKSIGLQVVAEGVEMNAQRENLLRLGCTYGQGYYFGKPMSVADFEKAWLRGAEG